MRRFGVLLAVAVVWFSVAAAVASAGTAGTLAIVAGKNRTVTPGPATAAPLGAFGVATNSSGNVYIADIKNDVVENVTPSGTLSIVAGNGSQGAITPGPATKTSIGFPSGIAVDGSGDLYVADFVGSVVEKVTPSGALSIVAGVVGQEGAPSPGPATKSEIDPDGVTADGSGNLYIADNSNSVIEKVTPSGTLSVAAGVVGQEGAPTPGPATKSDIDPDAVAVDGSGNLYISDRNNLVEAVTTSGSLSIVAGNGQAGAPIAGTATSSELHNPTGVTLDAAGNLYIADLDNDTVEKVTPTATLSIFAGTTESGPPTPGAAASSDLDEPAGVAVDGSGNLYIADSNNDVVEKVTPRGVLSILAGILDQSGAPTAGPARSSHLSDPRGVGVDRAGNVYIADNYFVERVSPSGTLSIIAGTGQEGRPAPGPATSSDLNQPSGVVVDSSGNLYIADTYNQVVEKVTPSGVLSIIAGMPGQSGPPTAGPATSSELFEPSGVALDDSGNLFIADSANNVVEKVTPSGTLSIFAGTGDYGAPTPGPATSSRLGGPEAVTTDGSGNVFVADTDNNIVEKVTPSGTLSIIAGTGRVGAPTEGTALHSDLADPLGVAVDQAGNLYIADSSNDDVEEVFGVGSSPPTLHATSTSVSCLPASVAVGAATTCAATVMDTAPSGKSTPTGSVSFTSSPTTGTFDAASCTLAVTGATGVATCQVSFTPSAMGSYTITGSYGGDGNHDMSSSQSGVVTATSATPTVDPTSVSVACSPGSVVVGNASTCTATVTDAAASGKSTPTGSVSFSNAPGTGSFSASSCALSVESCAVSFTPSSPGSYTITASYAGDSSHKPSSGQLGSLTASRPEPSTNPSSTGVSCSPASVTVGIGTTCTAVVTDTASSGKSTPSGSVSFTSAPTSGAFSTSSCTLAGTAVTGVAVCQVAFIPSVAGSYTVIGSYGGDGAHHGSDGHSGSVAASTPSTSGRASTAPATVSGTAASVLITCTGASACTVTVTLSVQETLKRGKVIAVAAKKGKTTKKTVAVGSATVTIAAGGSEKVNVGLNAAGKRLLAKHHRLKAQLTTTQSGHTAGSSTVTFKAKKRKR